MDLGERRFGAVRNDTSGIHITHRMPLAVKTQLASFRTAELIPVQAPSIEAGARLTGRRNVRAVGQPSGVFVITAARIKLR